MTQDYPADSVLAHACITVSPPRLNFRIMVVIIWTLFCSALSQVIRSPPPDPLTTGPRPNMILRRGLPRMLAVTQLTSTVVYLAEHPMPLDTQLTRVQISFEGIRMEKFRLTGCSRYSVQELWCTSE